VLRGFEPGASVFRVLRFRQAECGHLFAVHDFHGRFDDCGSERRGRSVIPLPSVLTTVLATARRANHLYSAGTTCQGAAAVEVAQTSHPGIGTGVNS
jgi:hypothetical protein